MHRARRFVSGFLNADGVDQGVQSSLRNVRVDWQLNGIDVADQVSKNTALSTASRDHTRCRFRASLAQAIARFNGCYTRLSHFAFA